MIDTISHIIDSSRQIINVIVPPKSNFEIYAPYVAVFVSLLTVAVNIWLNNKQIKNSHHILEKTISANWKSNIENVKINTALKKLEKFKELKDEIILITQKLIESNFGLPEYNSMLFELEIMKNKQAVFFIDRNLDDEFATKLIDSVSGFIDKLKVKNENFNLFGIVFFFYLDYSQLTYDFLDNETKRILSM